MTPHNAQDWWFSADGRRGFCWQSVKGYDFRPASDTGKSILYLYIESGIFHIADSDADKLFELVRKKMNSATPRKRSDPQ